MTNELKKVPELRFPEFDGEWEEEKIKSLFKVVSGSTPLRSKKEYFDKAEVPWVKTTDLNNNVLRITDEKISNIAVKEVSMRILPKNTLLIAMYGGFNQIGRTGVISFDSTINQAISALLDIEGKSDVNFLQAYFNFNVKKWRRVAASSRKDPNITKKDIEDFNITIPSLNEQKRLGEFFSKLDQQIELEEKKLAKLEEQKKGYMQKIFSQEIRFKDENRNEYPEWEEKVLGDVATIVGGGTPNTKVAEYWNGDINWFSPVEIGNDIFVNESKSKITELGLKKSSAKLLPTGTVLFTSRAGIGKTAILNSEACTNQGFQSIVPNQNMLDTYYIYSRTNQLKKYAEIVGSGSTFIEVSGVQMRKMPIMLPSIAEQEKIGVFFKKIDDSLKKQSNKIELLKKRKKGFLQKMFV
ncbi:restriction endonuclease subunit S [Mammaliicoccus sciuri]|uniref:restriction endonuclease subunit S n=1 Tax=Mammaliicoccus sciuri TaxID=1296 RepID=UPI002DBB5862|nr:restriction endonuclease subunit S [Mammaliicoccus sciuri]MEB7397227.1 restriction endonuclease subunit S [Mammaliicoccus sciuri]